MPSTPTPTSKEVNLHENDCNQEGDTQEDPELYPARFYPMGDHSETKKSSSKSTVDDGEAKTSLPKPIEDRIEARIGLPDTVVDSKHVSPVPKGIFPKYLYIIL